jgi:hypothetical protein
MVSAQEGIAMGRDEPQPRARSESTPDASRTARAGLAEYNANHHKYPAIESAVAKMERDLDTFIGADITPAKTAMAVSATALFAGVLLTKHKLLAARGRANRIGDLLELLPALVGSLQRTLRLLGSHDGQSDPDAPPADATPEERRAWSKRYVERVLAEGRSASE